MVEPVRKSRFNYKTPASATEEGQKRLQAYYEALGRFVDMFSRIETAVTLTLWAYAGTAPAIAKTILPGVRIDVGSKFIKELAKSTGAAPAARADLECVFQQLGIINGARNDLLHFGATSVAEGRAIVSNALKAKEEPREFPISPEALDDMTSDLRKIAAHLNYRHLGRPWPKAPLNRLALDDVLSAAWRYKHPVTPKTRSKKAQDEAD